MPLCFSDRRGIASALGLTVAHMVAIIALLFTIRHANNKKAQIRAELSEEQLARRKAESWDVLGDRHIDFNYGY